jgi:hypothetical protein
MDADCVPLCRQCHDEVHRIGLASCRPGLRRAVWDGLARMRELVAAQQNEDAMPVSMSLGRKGWVR